MDELVGALGKLTVDRVALPEDAVADSEELRGQAKLILEKLRTQARLPAVEKQVKDR